MKVSLITTIYNEFDNILIFLESYRNQTKYATEFIIVDGGSTDGTISLINSFIQDNDNLNIRLIVDKTCSKKYTSGPIAKGRNVAIGNTKYETIAVTDAGCILDRCWFEEIIKPFRDKKVDVVGGWYKAEVLNDFQKIYNDIYLPKLSELDIETFLPSSRSIAFKKQCWKKVCRYPEGTLTAEDTLFDINMKKKGCNFVFNKNAIVYWKCPSSYAEAVKKAEYYAIGDGQHKLYLKKFIFRNLFLVIPINILLSPMRRKNFKLSFGVMFAYQRGYIKGLLS